MEDIEDCEGCGEFAAECVCNDAALLAEYDALQAATVAVLRAAYDRFGNEGIASFLREARVHAYGEGLACIDRMLEHVEAGNLDSKESE